LKTNKNGAAIIVEPVADMGCIPRLRFLEGLRTLCTDNGILLILMMR
jgi:glutamate-1-semialdehyde aminotransferase